MQIEPWSNFTKDTKVAMENSLYVALSRQVALSENMTIVANNLANISTPGYRGQNMVFEEYIDDPRGAREPLSLVLDYGQYQNTDEGPLSLTGNPLDVALEGPGFFGVNTPDGIRYTRAGNFTVNENGTLMTPLGYPVAGQGGGEIVIPQEATNISIDYNGVVSTEDGEVGQLQITEFDNEQLLDPQGNSLYVTEEAGRPAENTRVKQGMLEGSNVQGITEMTRMIEVSREYQAIARMVQGEHDRQRSAIQRLLQTRA